MAQADFDFNANFDTGAILGGNDGTARLNSSLSNPLVGEGNYCREFSNPGAGDIAMSATIKSTVNGGEFFEIPSTKSISVRAWIRHTDVSDTGISTAAIGIGVKIHAGAPDLDENAPNGYSVFIGDTAQTSGGSFIHFIADGGGTVFFTSTGRAAFDNNWTKVRLDVIPIGTAEDLINVYDGSGATGSETWTLRYTKNILNSDPYYIPWAQSGNGKVGFWTVNGHNDNTLHIDRFQVFLEDV